MIGAAKLQSQTPIIRSTTTATPTSFAQIATSILVQNGPRIGIGTNNPSSLLALAKTTSIGTQGDTWSGAAATIRFETRNLSNVWRYWEISGGEDLLFRNVTNSSSPITPVRISLQGTVDLMDKLNINVQNVPLNHDKKIGIIVNNNLRRLFWTNNSFTGGDDLTVPLEFFFDAKQTGVADVTAMSIMPNGQIRIGPKNTLYENYLTNSIANNNQSIRLTVKGGVAATRFIATTQNWADWVFYEKWKNPTLEEEKESIEKNCTLVGVPSENEVKNGMDLAETDAILLSKIEQNYLHDINQQDLIKILFERIQALEKRVEELDSLTQK